MAEVQMLKNLPEECLLNISSFLLGTPQQLKFKNNKTFRQIQRKYNLDVFTISSSEYIRYIYEYDELCEYEELWYGYGIRNKDYTIEETLNMIRRQCDKLFSIIKPDGDTDSKMDFNSYVDGEEKPYII